MAALEQVLHPKDTRFRARISNTRGDHYRQLNITSMFIPRTSVFVRIFQTLEVTIFQTSPFIGHPVFVRVFQTLEVTILGTISLRPKDILFVRVFQTLEVTTIGSSRTSHFIPRTSVFARIFQTLEATIFGSPRTSIFIPRTSVFVRVFQTLEVTIFGSIRTSLFYPKDIRFRARISNTRGDH